MTKYMSRLIETIKLLEGEFLNVSFHERRMRASLRKLFGVNRRIDLEALLKKSYFPTTGLHRCRLVYDAQAYEVAYWPYVRRPIESLKVVMDDSIDYSLKFEDRNALNELLEQRDTCDDILIVKEGRVTDCSFANLAFRRGSAWFTPDRPLLQGTMRQKLIEQGKITPCSIHVRDISTFDTFKLINAMLEFESPEIDVSRIVV